MSELSELPPCPFCNGEALAEWDEPSVSTRTDDKHWRIGCANEDCPFMPNGYFETEKEAIEAWSKRVEIPSIEAIKKQERWETYQYLQRVARESGGSEEFVMGIEWASILFKPHDL